MALRELVYQKKVLDRLTDYVGELAVQKRRADKIAAANAWATPVSQNSCRISKPRMIRDKATHNETTKLLN